jgi:hypothetical protein
MQEKKFKVDRTETFFDKLSFHHNLYPYEETFGFVPWHMQEKNSRLIGPKLSLTSFLSITTSILMKKPLDLFRGICKKKNSRLIGPKLSLTSFLSITTSILNSIAKRDCFQSRVQIKGRSQECKHTKTRACFMAKLKGNGDTWAICY